MNGSLGARKKPTKLAKSTGVNGLIPVSIANSKVVLIGVRVIAAFNAAIVQIIANAGSRAGIVNATALPKHAPVKKSGMMIPPRHPPVTVMLIASILAKAKPKRANGLKPAPITELSS